MAGENGSAIIPDWNQNCKIVACTNWNAGEAVPIVTAAGLTKTMAPRNADSIESSEIIKPESDVHDFYRNVVRSIDGEETQIVTHAQLLRVMRIMEACFESDRLGQVVKFEDQ
jgi:predicted dehydrogenase